MEDAAGPLTGGKVVYGFRQSFVSPVFFFLSTVLIVLIVFSVLVIISTPTKRKRNVLSSVKVKEFLLLCKEMANFDFLIKRHICLCKFKLGR